MFAQGMRARVYDLPKNIDYMIYSNEGNLMNRSLVRKQSQQVLIKMKIFEKFRLRVRSVCSIGMARMWKLQVEI